ncbi:lipopolysaccharide biosynthesis protein [Flavobacterium sp. '19STA2R22 D10 B1']|uniref:lipopolysaccharide biosynthesis protein n=1 Tax=Flavobacterium aerium TaxID=3037261 RepID=UPI00278BCB5B|nr:lipopolysaccharide biosynthesis protein [Flavobacterium sp. '19STA2R22 D10 B1']
MDKETPNGEINLKELLLKSREWYVYLISKYKIILLVAFIGSVLGLVYSYTKGPTYTATLSFALEDEKSGGLGGALGLASQFGFDIGGSGGGAFTGTNLTELFKSRSMVEQTLLSPIVLDGKNITLAEMYIQNNNWRDLWKDKSKFKNIQFLPNSERKKFSRIQDSILGKMYNELSTSSLVVGQKDKKISIISLDMKSDNEIFAKSFVENLAKVVSDFYIDTKSKKARINMAILQRQTDSIRGELNGAITGVAVANDNTFNLNPALNIRRVPSVKRQVDVQANTAILTELVKQTELAKVTLRKETPLIQIIDRPIYPLKKEKFGKTKGVILGGFIGGFLILLILVVKRIWKDITEQ